jgi:transposase
MGYKRVTIVDAWEIIRRWHSGQSRSEIAKVLGYDRKTVKKYIKRAQAVGVLRGEPLPERSEVMGVLGGIVSEIKRPAKAQELLAPHFEEIVTLVTDRLNPLLPKTAFDAVCTKHHLTGEVSYGTFKRMARRHQLLFHPERVTCRIETDPGEEVQIDYGRMGLLTDPLCGRKRIVYAFIATLSHSRHKYVEFTWSQNQKSFVSSHVRMFTYFEGVVARVTLDNLKSGVITPDLYDPRMNRAYREMSEFYGCFLDPCRVAHPKDKGKTERDVQTVRQEFRKLLVLHPTMDIHEANRLVQRWCIEEYGQREHGTTGLRPYPTFLEKERPVLRPLPQDPFEIPTWKEAKVHPDHYIQFARKTYSVPDPYVGKTVWVRGTEKIIFVYYHERLIKQHVITDNYRHTDPEDFPPNMRAVLDRGIPAKLQKEALHIGPAFAALIRAVLSPHAYLTMRRAQGLVRVAEKSSPALVEEAARLALTHRLSPVPKLFRHLLEKIARDKENNTPLPLSPESREFLRDSEYFVYASPQEKERSI